jgi:hypothetical protein
MDTATKEGGSGAYDENGGLIVTFEVDRVHGVPAGERWANIAVLSRSRPVDLRRRDG